MSFETHRKINHFSVISEQVISANSIRDIIATTSNKIMGIKAMRERYKPIGLRDAKLIYEAVEAEDLDHLTP